MRCVTVGPPPPARFVNASRSVSARGAGSSSRTSTPTPARSACGVKCTNSNGSLPRAFEVHGLPHPARFPVALLALELERVRRVVHADHEPVRRTCSRLRPARRKTGCSRLDARSASGHRATRWCASPMRRIPEDATSAPGGGTVMSRHTNRYHRLSGIPESGRPRKTARRSPVLTVALGSASPRVPRCFVDRTRIGQRPLRLSHCARWKSGRGCSGRGILSLVLE